MLYFCWYKFSRLRDTIPMLCLRSLKYITFPLFVFSETQFFCSLSDPCNTVSLPSFESLKHIFSAHFLISTSFSLLFLISAIQILCSLSDLYNYNTDTLYSFGSLQHRFSAFFLISTTTTQIQTGTLYSFWYLQVCNTVSLHSFCSQQHNFS